MKSNPLSGTSRQRLFSNLFAGVYAAGSKVIIQFALALIFLHHWSPAQFGSWIAIFSLAAIVRIFDVGLGVVSGNRMSIFGARGDWEQAGKAASALLFLNSIGFLLLSLLIWTFAFILPWKDWLHAPSFSNREISLTLVFLCMTLLGEIFSNNLYGFYRATANTAKGSLLVFSGPYLQALAVAVIFLFNQSAIIVAFSMLLVQWILNIINLVVVLFQKGPLRPKFKDLRRTEILYLLKNSSTFCFFPLSQFMLFNGCNLVINATLGPVMLTSFYTLRVLTKGLNFVAQIIKQTILPEAAILYGVGKNKEVGTLMTVGLSLFMSFALGYALLLLMFQSEILYWWTNNRVNESSLELGLFLFSAFIEGSSLLILTSVQSTNKQGKMGLYMFLVTLLVPVLIVYGAQWQLLGAIVALCIGNCVKLCAALLLKKWIWTPRMRTDT